ncbi:MAG TPA: adenylate/guanylate cyclase domain-containing protein [Saprospiraceae bacterium]
MTSTRQLAAIMFADIEGYTSLMQEDETMALNLLGKLKEKLEEEVKLHKGNILEVRGDGVMCRFTSTLEAVRAAIALQQEMQKIPIVPLRIGIHTGDIIISADAVFGDGVNIASRVETIAVPGSIFITARVYEDIKNQKDIQAQSLGTYSFKNVKEPVGIYAISNIGITVPDPNNIKGKGEKTRPGCILVLPFVNLSPDAHQDYFSDGLTEELISSLSRVKELRIISRTTSMQYKGTQKDIKTIREETEVSYILEGSVRRHGNDLRITAQFVDAVRDIHLWSDSYRGVIDNIFEIQESVASNIVDALRIQLTEEEKDNLQKRFTENTEAYQLYLQGRYFWNKRNEGSLETAIRYFENALQKDRHYALAWAGLADSYNLLGEYTSRSRKELNPMAKAAAQQALLLDNQLAEAHISLASILMLGEWDWTNAGREFRIGLELNPGYATGHHWYAEWLLFHCRYEEALQEMALASELDPISIAILKDLGMTYYYTRQYDKALETSAKTLELDPDFSHAYRLRSLAFLSKGMFDEAIAENEGWRKRGDNEGKAKLALANIYACSGRNEEALKLIEEILNTYKLSGNDYRSMSQIYAALGDKEEAFKWLELSYARREESLCNIRVDPKWDPIKDDPRFDAIVQKIGL